MSNLHRNPCRVVTTFFAACVWGGLTGCQGAPPTANSTPTAGQPSPVATAIPDVSTKVQVEQAIAAYLPQEIGVPLKTVSCPEQLSLATGKMFDCNVKIAAGNFPVKVTVKDANGNLTLKTRQILLLPEAERELQQSIRQRDKLEVKADCGGQVRIPQKVGERFECKLTDKTGKTGTATLTVISKEGKVDAKWKFSAIAVEQP